MNNDIPPSARPAAKPMSLLGKVGLGMVSIALIQIAIGQGISFYRWQTEGEFGYADQALSELSRLRIALQEYKAKTGAYPGSLTELKEPPGKVQLHASHERHGYSAEITQYVGNEACDGKGLKDTGGWGYIFDQKSLCHGRIFLNCPELRKGKSKAWWMY